MTPENLNRLSMWVTIGIVIVAAFMFGGQWAFGDTNGSGSSPLSVHLAVPDLSSTTAPPVSAATTETLGSMESTTTRPSAPIVLSQRIERAGVEASGSTAVPTTPPPTRTATATTTTVTAPPEAEPVATTVPAPTTTTVPVTMPPVAATTTTTLPTTPPSTTEPSTTTTSTTTTTVVSEVPGIFVERFDGRAQGDSDEWSVHLDVALGATTSGTYRGQVFVSWSGDGSGSVVLEAGGSGKASAAIGPFPGERITITVTDVRAPGWVYTPNLNQSATTLTIAPPDD